MHKVNDLYAYMVDDPHDGEAVLTRDTPSGQIPLIGRTREMLELYHHEARDTADALRMPLIVGHFTRVREGK